MANCCIEHMTIIAEYERRQTFKTSNPGARYRQSRFPALLAWGGFHFAHSASSKFARLDLVSKMEEVTVIYDRSGKTMHQLYKKKRTVVPLSCLSQNMLHAILATEDQNFYKHSGYDSIAILRAVWANLKAGRVIQGGSTLTQQLAKNTFLTSQRSFRRKIEEFWLAREIEKHYSKNQILELYAKRQPGSAFKPIVLGDLKAYERFLCP